MSITGIKFTNLPTKIKLFLKDISEPISIIENDGEVKLIMKLIKTNFRIPSYLKNLQIYFFKDRFVLTFTYYNTSYITIFLY